MTGYFSSAVIGFQNEVATRDEREEEAREPQNISKRHPGKSDYWEVMSISIDLLRRLLDIQIDIVIVYICICTKHITVMKQFLWFLFGIVLLWNKEKTDYYDGQVVEAGKNQVFRQIGIYRYRTAQDNILKTVPIVELADQ